MPEAVPTARAWARRVLVGDAGAHPDAAVLAAAVAHADARLRGRLVALIGPTGYATLVARAVRLAQTAHPAVEHVTVDDGPTEAQGSLRGVREVVETARASGADPRAVEDGLTAILAHVIGLLITFIGEDLALRLVREAWPELAHGPVASGRRA